MTKKLTQKQENFCRLVIELGNQAEAYRQSYSTNGDAQQCASEANKLVKTPHIATRLEELKEKASSRHNVTVDSLLKELEEARTIAATCETPQSSAMVAASMSKAKLLGLDKQIIETTIKIDDSGGNDW